MQANGYDAMQKHFAGAGMALGVGTDSCGIFRSQLRTGSLDAQYYRCHYKGDRTFVPIS